MKTKQIKKSDFDYFYSLLEKDFCEEERKSKQDELKSFSNKYFKPYFIYIGDKIYGYFICWEFDDFVFGEHFAILENDRNKGVGSSFLKSYLSKLKKTFIFEVERPHDENSKRRISFYKRNGIIINGFDYYQPSYHGKDEKIPMFIASYPKEISQEEYLMYTKIIRENVYN